MRAISECRTCCRRTITGTHGPCVARTSSHVRPRANGAKGRAQGYLWHSRGWLSSMSTKAACPITALVVCALVATTCRSPTDFSSALIALMRDPRISSACERDCGQIFVDPRLFSRGPSYYPPESLAVVRQLAAEGSGTSFGDTRVVFRKAPEDSMPAMGSVVRSYVRSSADTAYVIVLEFQGRLASFSVVARLDSVGRGWKGRVETVSIH